MPRIRPCILLLATFLSLPAVADGTTEFCLDGKLDLGARYQGMAPAAGEFYPTTWCIVSDDDSTRVRFDGSGRSNPDMDGEWTVDYLPPDVVRIVNAESPPDIEFQGTDNLNEALSARRADPMRLLQELKSTPDALKGVDIETADGRISSVLTSIELPLRGQVDVEWKWDWTDREKPGLKLVVDGDVLFDATGRWRDIPDTEADSLWQLSDGVEPIEVPGDAWPSRINMTLIKLTDNVYLVRGVRTGFQHFVVDTERGLIVADAPAGWVEFHHIPPSELTPGFEGSRLSENFIDYLAVQFPGRPILAVALTHFHDDHAGGARAFAFAGAKIYATKESAGFLQKALNRKSISTDRLGEKGADVNVLPVSETVTLGSEPNRVQFMALGRGPHSDSMLGVLALDKDYFFVSDVHVPRDDADTPPQHRLVTECWFARWAVDNLPPAARVVNSHSDIVTPVSRLGRYLDSDGCNAS